MMAFSLFIKECRSVMRSAAYVVFVIAILLFYHLQIGTMIPDHIAEAANSTQSAELGKYNPLIEPDAESGFYGVKKAEVPEVIMPTLIGRLAEDVQRNTFSAYYFGFYRAVHLKESELELLQGIIRDCTGMDYKTVSELMPEEISVVCSYETFQDKMKIAEDLIGSSSSYTYEAYSQIATVPKTYEEAADDYAWITSVERVSGAYARVFCDYMNIIALFFSVFITVAVLMRDKRQGIDEVLFSRSISTAKLLLIRYLACVASLILPFIAVSVLPTCRFIVFGIQTGLDVNALAYLQAILLWIAPSVMISAAVGFLMTFLTENHAGILVWSVISFISLVTSAEHLADGVYTLNPLVRFNSLEHTERFYAGLSAFLYNRLFYAVLAVIILMISMWIYDRRRRGIPNVCNSIRTLFTDPENAAEAGDCEESVFVRCTADCSHAAAEYPES